MSCSEAGVGVLTAWIVTFRETAAVTRFESRSPEATASLAHTLTDSILSYSRRLVQIDVGDDLRAGLLFGPANKHGIIAVTGGKQCLKHAL